ncbi:TBPIP-domain-containing protein [Hygrophoropsis aurantiaca]|uniref:TBPIP-domain-containing protein n=1 Tax=Hygrophoropsis aurantiaca TaxID=72124 RepID=A0ACB7ZR74_9AGAM|nr:TBPIP-domain-containing protein [Hygrophoropsis aurantiaca]
MNRPYGAVDVSANLKGAVPKAATPKILVALAEKGALVQKVYGELSGVSGRCAFGVVKGAVPKAATPKILVALAEKGALVQKVYGKTSVFAPNQASIPPAAPGLDAECAALDAAVAQLGAEVARLGGELAKLRSTPTDAELAVQLAETEARIQTLTTRLLPLRARARARNDAAGPEKDGSPGTQGPEIASPVREPEIASPAHKPEIASPAHKPETVSPLRELEADWTRWRGEWLRRRRVFESFWPLLTDALPPAEAEALAEELGIERDGGECLALLVEAGGKRKRA